MKLETTKQTLERCPFSAPTLYRLIGRGLFPKPVKIGCRSYWIPEETEAALQGFADKRQS